MHTEIVPEYAGRGLGRQLVRGALDDVASNHGNVLPYCSFVRSLIARDQAYFEPLCRTGRAVLWATKRRRLAKAVELSPVAA